MYVYIYIHVISGISVERTYVSSLLQRLIKSLLATYKDLRVFA